MHLAPLSVYRGGRSLSAIAESTLPKNEFWVMQCLGSRANFNGHANFQEWLGSIPLDWIQQWTRLGETTTREALKNLIAWGYVESRNVFGADGRQLGNEYRITRKVFDEYAVTLGARHPGREVVFQKTRPHLSVVPAADPAGDVPPPSDLDAPAWSEPAEPEAGLPISEGGGSESEHTIPEPYTGEKIPLTSTLPPRACVRVDPPFRGRLTAAELLVQEIFRESDWRFKNQALRAAAAEAQHKHGLEALERFRDAVVKEGDDGRLGFHRSTFIRAVASEAAKLAAPPEQRFVW